MTVFIRNASPLKAVALLHVLVDRAGGGQLLANDESAIRSVNYVLFTADVIHLERSGRPIYGETWFRGYSGEVSGVHLYGILRAAEELAETDGYLGLKRPRRENFSLVGSREERCERIARSHTRLSESDKLALFEAYDTLKRHPDPKAHVEATKLYGDKRSINDQDSIIEHGVDADDFLSYLVF